MLAFMARNSLQRLCKWSSSLACGRVCILRVLEGGTAAIRRIDAFKGEISTALAGILSIALDFPPLALVAATLATTSVPEPNMRIDGGSPGDANVSIALRPGRSCRLIIIIPLSFVVVWLFLGRLLLGLACSVIWARLRRRLIHVDGPRE